MEHANSFDTYPWKFHIVNSPPPCHAVMWYLSNWPDCQSKMCWGNKLQSIFTPLAESGFYVSYIPAFASFELFWADAADCLPSVCRNSLPEMFCKKSVPRKFPKFTGKHLCQILFFNKVAGLRPATFKRDSGVGVYQWILRNF